MKWSLTKNNEDKNQKSKNSLVLKIETFFEDNELPYNSNELDENSHVFTCPYFMIIQDSDDVYYHVYTTTKPDMSADMAIELYKIFPDVIISDMIYVSEVVYAVILIRMKLSIEVTLK